MTSIQISDEVENGPGSVDVTNCNEADVSS